MAPKKAAKAVAAPVAPLYVIKSCDEADLLGLELGQASLKRAALQAEANQKKTAIDQEYAPQLEKLATAENQLQASLDAFAAKHGQREDLNYIEIVSAGGGMAIFYDDEGDVIKRLKRSTVWAHLVKATESIAKNDLKKIPEKLHERFGFTYAPTKVIYSVKPKLDQVLIYAEKQQQARSGRRGNSK